MKCPVCRTETFSRVTAGDKEVDRCSACGGFWFDYGEIRELTEGRLDSDSDAAGSPDRPAGPGAIRRSGALLSRLRGRAASMSCPRCESPLEAVDFQMTGIAVLRCPSCGGIFAPRSASAGIASRFRFMKKNGGKFAALGETLARREKERMEAGPAGRSAGGMSIPLPVVVPLADDAPAISTLPVVTISLIVLAAGLYAIGQARGAPIPLPGGLAGLPSGTGFVPGIPKISLLLAPFLQSGILPLAAGSLFLFVLGDNVEDRMGSVAYFILYLACGVCAGIGHVILGKAGGTPALTGPGAVAGVAGAYLVFFPNVSIRMYGMGRMITLPAYLFCCAWLVAVFLAGPAGPIASLVDPARLSLPGNLAGFASGAGSAILWRYWERPAL